MRWLAWGVLFAAGMAGAQGVVQPAVSSSAQGEAQLSPQAAYDEASRPVDIVHRAVSNWSEVEQASLGVARKKAKVACAARDPLQYKGEDLLADARLCAFAQMWEQVQQAATGYLIAQSAATDEEKKSGFPNLAMAFDYEVQASLHLKNTVNAFGTAQTMLRTVAYDDLVSEASDAVVRYLQLMQTDEALAVLVQRQPELLAMLKARGAGTGSVGAGHGAGALDGLLASARTPLTVHDIYADAIMLPAMQQFAKMPEKAAASYAELEAALPQGLSADDAILIGALRRQYKLLGAPLPEIAASASLMNPAGAKASDVNRKSAGAYLLFPDWCAQCVAMYPRFNGAAKALKAEGVQFYALLAQANSVAAVHPVLKAGAKRPTHVESKVETTPSAADQLAGTQTWIVPEKTVEMFAATDFPLLVVTDGCGVVRYTGIAPDNVLVEGGLIYQVAERVLQQWPRKSLAAMHGATREELRCEVEGQAGG